jgi:hypothetical protein
LIVIAILSLILIVALIVLILVVTRIGRRGLLIIRRGLVVVGIVLLVLLLDRGLIVVLLLVLLICSCRLIVGLIVLLGLSHQRGARHQCRNCKYAKDAVKSSHRNLPGEQHAFPIAAPGTGGAGIGVATTLNPTGRKEFRNILAENSLKTRVWGPLGY